MGQPQRPDDEISGTKARTVGAGRYELGRQLGRGGMAEVSMAHDVRLGRTVAIKTLRPDLAQDPVARSRFGREAQNAASLNHPAIVSVYDTGEDRIGGDLVPFIVMECVEGRTIRELVMEGSPIPHEQALRITEGVLEALEYSHRHGIIHRDIKPANVIITNTDAVKVMDFGIARALHSAATTMTQTGMVMGTPQYLSPEQALGRTVDARSDLYSSGCLLYELLALRPPFNGDTPLSVVYQHVQDDPRPPSSLDASIPAHLDAIALKALAKNPDDRYQTAEEMRMDVRRALTGQTVYIAPPPGAQTRTQPVWAQGATTSAPTAHLRGGPATAGHEAVRTGAMPMGPHTLSPHDGGTGAYPQAEGGQGRRRGVVYAIVVAVVIAVIVGVAIAVNALGKDDDKGGSGSQNSGTPTPTGTGPSTDAGANPQPSVETPTESATEKAPTTRSGQGNSTRPQSTAATYPGGGGAPTSKQATASASASPTQTTTSATPTETATKSTAPTNNTSSQPPTGAPVTPTAPLG